MDLLAPGTVAAISSCRALSATGAKDAAWLRQPLFTFLSLRRLNMEVRTGSANFRGSTGRVSGHPALKLLHDVRPYSACPHQEQ